MGHIASEAVVMEHNITAVCEEQKRLEQERELLDTEDSGSDNDSGEVDQSIMDISDDGDNADKSAGYGGLSNAGNSANTDKVGTDTFTGSCDGLGNAGTSANTDKVGTDTFTGSCGGLGNAGSSANTDKVGTVTFTGSNTGNGTDKVHTATDSDMVTSAITDKVGTGTTAAVGIVDIASGSCCGGANTKKVGTSFSKGTVSFSAITDKVGTGTNPTTRRETMPPPEDGTYLAVNLYKRKASVAPNLLGGAPCNPAASGSLYNGEASRIQHCHTSFDFPTKLNVMTSFNIDKMRCGCCTEHWKILEKRVEARYVERRTFVLTDQHFVATAPAATPGKQCLKIIRIENATLWELYNFFSAMLSQGDLDLPVGSAILFGSASHLANVGLTYYTEELVMVNKKFQPTV